MDRQQESLEVCSLIVEIRLCMIKQMDRCDESRTLDLDVLIEAVAEVCFHS